MSESWRDWPRAQGYRSETVRASDGTALRVVVGGRPGAPRVVLLHGVPQHAYAWRSVMEGLVDQFHVLAPDLRGIGDSDIPSPARYDLDQLAADVHAVRGDEPCILVGHDWGGVIAFYTAGHAPEGIRHLVVANGPHLPAYEAELAKPSQAIRSWYTAMFQIPGIEHLLWPGFFGWMIRSSSPSDLFSKEEVDFYKAPLAEPGRIAATLAYYRQASITVKAGFADEPRIEVPTTLLWGDADRALAPSHPEAVRRYVEHLEVRPLPGISHWVPEACPDAIVRAIRDVERE